MEAAIRNPDATGFRQGGTMRVGKSVARRFADLAFMMLLAVVVIPGISPAMAEYNPLPSWNDGPARKAIIEFVQATTDKSNPKFVPPEARIATFDQDGTLWAEQPMYFQFFFALDRVKALAPQHPEWKDKEPFASLLKGDGKGALAGGEHAMLEIVMATHAGMTTEEFAQTVKDWTATARHPKTKRPYTEMVYQPMLELLAYLRENGFKTFIVSGGGVEFMRPYAEKAYGIPPEQVIGSSIKTKFELRDGKPVLVRLPEVDFIDDKEGKPVSIHRHIGRRPIAAFGNSDGDLQMLQWTTAGSGARFALLVHHTDAEREWAYDRTSPIGRLDKALDEAQSKGWTVVDMKNDWKIVFPAEWFFYDQNQWGGRCYIDNASIQRTPEGTIRVWHRIEESTGSGVGKSIQEEWREVDCSHRRYRILERKTFTVWGPGDESRPIFGIPAHWDDFNPSLDSHRTFYGVMCGFFPPR